MLTRRRFLTNGIGIVALGAGGFGGLRYATADVEDVIVRIVQHYLGDQGLVTGAAEAFAADYAPLSEFNWKYRTLWASSLYFEPLVRDALPASNRRRLENYDRRVVTEFLLSSDRDLLDPDATAPMDYFGLTVDRQCNPFVRFVEAA